MGFTITVAITLAVWTIQALASTEVSKARTEKQQLRNQLLEFEAEKKTGSHYAKLAPSVEIMNARDTWKIFGALEAWSVHIATSDQLQLSTKSVGTFYETCSISFAIEITINAHYRLPVCSEGRATTIQTMASTPTTCFICYQGWESSCIFARLAKTHIDSQE